MSLSKVVRTPQLQTASVLEVLRYVASLPLPVCSVLTPESAHTAKADLVSLGKLPARDTCFEG